MAMHKRLNLLRHAKSDWEDPSMPDFDRPLSKRGKRDAPNMGARMHAKQITPRLFISSTALRARTTAQLVMAELGLSARLILAENLYLASAHEMLEILCAHGSGYDDVVLVGHNPGITDLANRISDAQIDNIPTCGWFALEAAIQNWEELRTTKGNFTFFDYPKAT